jgi:hypothetical protein
MLRAAHDKGMRVDGRSGRVLLVMASCVFAGLLWASSGLTELAGRPSGSRASAPTGAASIARRSTGAASDARRPPGATSDVRPRNQASVDLASMAPVSLAQQAYSMAAPVFLSDPEATHAGGVAVGDVSGDGRDDLVFLSPRYAANPAYDRMAATRSDAIKALGVLVPRNLVTCFRAGRRGMDNDDQRIGRSWHDAPNGFARSPLQSPVAGSRWPDSGPAVSVGSIRQPRHALDEAPCAVGTLQVQMLPRGHSRLLRDARASRRRLHYAHA